MLHAAGANWETCSLDVGKCCNTYPSHNQTITCARLPRANITCPPGYTINILSSKWGRQEDHHCKKRYSLRRLKNCGPEDVFVPCNGETGPCIINLSQFALPCTYNRWSIFYETLYLDLNYTCIEGNTIIT